MDANYRESLGLSRLRKQLSPIPPHPSNGGSKGYSHADRTAILMNAAARQPTTASTRTIRRWKKEGIRAFKSTGNKATTKIHGIHQRDLLLYRMAYPKATADEVRRFLYEDVPGSKLFSRSDITRAETRLGMTRKRGSTTAWQAYLPRNILRRDLFWSQPPPLGVVGIPFHEFVDIDECAIFFETADRNVGKSYTGVRVREAGPHGFNQKWTLLMAIDPSGFVHLKIDTNTGTTSLIFATFVEQVNHRLQGTGRRTFLWDNLSSHHADMVSFAVLRAGNRIVPRAPYYPIDGPIEFVFNQIESQLKLQLPTIHNEADLVSAIHNIVGNLTSSFGRTFTHCGY